MEIKSAQRQLLENFSKLVAEDQGIIEEEANFIRIVQAGIDPDNGSIQVHHGFSVDMVAFENSCRMYDSNQPQMLKSIADIAYEQSLKDSGPKSLVDQRLVAAASTLKCYECDFTTNDPKKLQLHNFGHKLGVDIHELFEQNKVTVKGEDGVAQTIYRCPICKKSINSLHQLEQHVLNVHVTDKENTYTCEYCAQQIRGLSAYTSHKILHTAKSLFVCKVPGCTVSSSSIQQIIRHVRNSHYYQQSYAPNGQKVHRKLPGRPIDYVAIDEKQLSQSDLSTLKKTMQEACRRPIQVEADNRMLCKLCSVGTSSNSTQCVICGEDFKTKHKLEEHVKTHSERERTINCLRCGTEFVYMKDGRWEFGHGQMEKVRDEKPILKASRILREFLPAPLIARSQEAEADIKQESKNLGKKMIMNPSGTGTRQAQEFAKQNQVQAEWQRGKTGGAVVNVLEASYQGLFSIQYDMEVPEMYKTIEEVFARINSFEYDFNKDEEEARKKGVMPSELDPCRSHREKFPYAESYKLKIQIDRAIIWLVEKIHKANLQPIMIQPDQIDEFQDIQDAFNDNRSHQNLAMAKKDNCYFTPEFLQSFDIKNITGRDFLKERVKFAATKLGFTIDAAMSARGNKQVVTMRCQVGRKEWVKKHTNRQPKGIPQFHQCPFTIWYERQISIATGDGQTPFVMRTFDMRHSHPLSLQYSIF